MHTRTLICLPASPGRQRRKEEKASKPRLLTYIFQTRFKSRQEQAYHEMSASIVGNHLAAVGNLRTPNAGTASVPCIYVAALFSQCLKYIFTLGLRSLFPEGELRKGSIPVNRGGN